MCFVSISFAQPEEALDDVVQSLHVFELMPPVLDAPELTPEVEMEGKKDMDKKEKMKEYKNPVKADTADHSDKSAKSPVKDAGSKLPKGGDNIAKGGAEEKGRPAPTAQKMAGDFENTPGKAKSTSYKKQEKANTADGSDKSAKSPVASK